MLVETKTYDETVDQHRQVSVSDDSRDVGTERGIQLNLTTAEKTAVIFLFVSQVICIYHVKQVRTSVLSRNLGDRIGLRWSSRSGENCEGPANLNQKEHSHHVEFCGSWIGKIDWSDWYCSWSMRSWQLYLWVHLVGL